MDLDDLLDDMDNSGGRPADPAPPRGRGMTFGREEKKKPKADDGWGDLGVEDEGLEDAGQSKPKSSGLGARNLNQDRSGGGGVLDNKPTKQASFGFGGVDGLKKEPKKPEDDGDEWGLDLDSKPTQNSGFGGRLLGRKPKKDDDDLDDFLDDLEAKRGVESTKPAPPEPVQAPVQRAKTAVTRSPWGGSTELDDLDDEPAESASQRGAKAAEIQAAKRRSLFGLGSTGAAQQEQPKARAATAPRQTASNIQRVNQVPVNNAAFLDSNEHSRQGDLAEGNNSIGSQGSGIEMIENPNSRSRRMIRPPTAAGRQANTADGAQRQDGGSSSLRPPSGQNPGLNQIQQLHQNNRLTRPDTGGNRKPSVGMGSRGTNDNHEDGGILDLLDESQNAHSNAGSHFSGGQNRLGIPNQGVKKEFGMTSSHADFERADDDLDDEYDEEYESEEENEDSDDDAGSFYQPTLIAKIAKPKGKKKKKKKKGKSAGKGQRAGAVSLATSGEGNFQFDASARKANTLSSDQGAPGGKGRGGGIPTYPHATTGGAGLQGNLSQIGSGAASGHLAGGSAFSLSPPKLPRPRDPKGMLEYDIEEERYKIQQMEARSRQELEKVRTDHQLALEDSERMHKQKRSQHEEEKQALTNDKNTAVEEAKKKLTQLNHMDIENREMQYAKNLENQRALFEDQQHNLKKQLQERVQINELAQQINQSTGNISSLVSRIGAANQGELQRREDDILRREKDVDEKRRLIQERRLLIEQRRRKLQQEVEEIKSRETETRMDYQREKGEISADLDKIEMEHLKEVRQVRDKVIEQEVETRKVRAECERGAAQIEREEFTHRGKMDQWQVEKKQIRQAHENFNVESKSQQKELTLKLEAVHDTMREVLRDENEFEKKQSDFDDEYNKVVAENDALQEELDKYCIEKEQFDRNAQQVKEQGEQDQLDSEKIGWFKANKDRLKEELRLRKQELEQERQSLREGKIKLGIFKNDLSTKQKTIESLRYNYIKGDAQSIVQRGEAIEASKRQFAPMKAPMPQADSYAAEMPASLLKGQGPLSQVPRFNYDEYMKSLTNKISCNAPNASAYIGADFQAYILRERESYLQSIHEVEKDTPLVASIVQLREQQVANGNRRMYTPDPGMRSLNLPQTASATSLQFMSGGLSSDRE